MSKKIVARAQAPEPECRISLRELARLLHAFRIRQEETQQQVETRLDPTLKQRYGGVPGLEEGGSGLDRLSHRDLERIAEAYRIPKLMLDPLLSERSEEICLVERFDQSIAVGGSAGAEQYGRGTHYRVPARKLKHTEEVAIVHLEIAPGGHSDTHAHVGDELILVLDGTVEVRLANSGLWTHLNKGDYIHFYAEQQHSAWNTSTKPVQLFIIRFYQLESSGTRFELLQALSAGNPSANLITRVVTEVKAALMPFDMRANRNEAAEVLDRFGLGRLLLLICPEEFRGSGNGLSLKALAKRAADHQLRYKQSWFDRLHHGQAAVRAEELPTLAKVIYEVEPLLSYDFVFPALRNAVVVRQPDDLRLLPENFVPSQDVRYRVPCRRLADSDLAIAMLELAPGAGTPVNRHPGHELLLPLEGVIEVRIGGMGARLDAAEHLYAHYHSRLDHCVVNVGDQWAKQLVLRFYE